MRTKKNPKIDLNKKSSFYFSIGLFLVLLISWQAIEYKNYDDDGYGLSLIHISEPRDRG